MSLASFAVRTCTIQALRGQTLAGDTVEDSPIDPVSLAVGATAPLIAVFSDTEVLHAQGRSFLESQDVEHGHTVDLTVHVFLPPNPAVPMPGQPDIMLDARESGAAFAVDLLYRQITRALLLNDGVWADLWRRAVNSVVIIEAKAYVVQTEKGVRVPAREIMMRLDVLDEPSFGGDAVPFWADFQAAMSASDDILDLAPIVAAAIQGDALPEWRATAALLGLRPEDMVDVSLGPLGGAMTDPIVQMVEVAVDGASNEAPDGALDITPTSDPATP